MIDQTIINWIIGGAGALLGIFLKTLLESVKDLQKADQALTRQVSEIEILVAGSYVKRDDLDKMMVAIFTKLDRIENKLDGKVDK